MSALKDVLRNIAIKPIRISKEEHNLFSKVLRSERSDLLLTIYSRSKFYFWFQMQAIEKDLMIRWPLAAFVASNTIQQLAVFDAMLTNNKIEFFVHSGNQIIFDDVLKKLKLALNNQELKDPDKAYKWDVQNLYEEQHIIDSLYYELSGEDFTLLENLAKGNIGFSTAILGFIGGQYPGIMDFWYDENNVSRKFKNLIHNKVAKPKFPKNSDLKNISDRCNYGFMIANALFKDSKKIKFEKPKTIDNSYRLFKYKGRQTSKSLRVVRLKDNIHRLNSLLNDNFVNREEIKRILSVIKTDSKRIGKSNSKEVFILNYDFRIIKRIAQLDTFKSKRDILFKIIKGILTNKTKVRYREYIEEFSKEVITRQ